MATAAEIRGNIDIGRKIAEKVLADFQRHYKEALPGCFTPTPEGMAVFKLGCLAQAAGMLMGEATLFRGLTSDACIVPDCECDRENAFSNAQEGVTIFARQVVDEYIARILK